MALARSFVEKVGKKLQVAQAKPDPANQIPEGQILLLQPRLTDRVLVDASISALRKGNVLYYSFRDFCNGLEFPIEVNSENATANGWYIRQNYTFRMDLKQGFVQSRGQQYNVRSDEWFYEDGDLFVSSVSINNWMKIESDVVWESLLVDLAADTPFPLEDKIARRKRQLDKSNVPAEPQLPRADNPYQLLSAPHADVSLSTTYRQDQSLNTSILSRMSVNTAGDVLDHTVRTNSTTTSEHGLENLRISAEKQSENNDLLGPLHAKRYELGDITPVDIPNTGGFNEEWGARVTNALEDEKTASTSRVFEGDIPPDWDVELYDGDQLIAFQTATADGRYSFDDVNLYAGDNNFRLVFYGPQGEIREEEVNIPVSLDAVGADKKLYDVSLTLNDVNTYNYLPSEDPDHGSPTLSASYEQGIADGFSVNGGLKSTMANMKRKTFVSTGAVTRIGDTLLNTTLVTDEDLEMAFENVARRSIGEHSIRSSTVFQTSGYDPNNDDSDLFKWRSTFDMRGPLGKFYGEKLSYTLNTIYTIGPGQFTNMRATFGQNTRYGQYTIGHALEATHTDDPTSTAPTDLKEIASVFNVRRSIGNTRVRGTVRLRYVPETEWDQFTLNLSRNLDTDMQGQVEFNYDPDTSLTDAMAQINWQREKYVLSPQLRIDSDHNIQASINMRFGLQPNRITNKTEMTRNYVANQGIVKAFVYLDRNGNNVFDDKDEPIEGVRVKSVQVPRSATTNDDGLALLDRLPEYQATDITVESASFSDPFYTAGFDGLSVYPRPGAPVDINFPVHMAGEIDGTISKPGPHGINAAGGLHVQLINTRGEVTLSSLTAFDGYYVLSVIPPGQYLLMITPDDLKGTGLRQPWPQKIMVGYDGKVTSGQNIVLEEGMEIPIAFYKPPKKSMSAAAELVNPPPNHIEIGLGQYRSALLAQIVQLRIHNILRNAGLSLPKINSTAVKDGQALVATLDSTQLDQGRVMCAALVAHNLTCGLTVSPTFLLAAPSIAHKSNQEALASDEKIVAVAP